MPESTEAPDLGQRLRSMQSWRRRLRPRHIWVVISATMAVVGVLGSLLAAGAVARDDAGKS
jgi:beta-lactamase regulating signal transducer with metallopeptidase domain